VTAETREEHLARSVRLYLDRNWSVVSDTEYSAIVKSPQNGNVDFVGIVKVLFFGFLSWLFVVTPNWLQVLQTPAESSPTRAGTMFLAMLFLSSFIYQSWKFIQGRGRTDVGGKQIKIEVDEYGRITKHYG
jgi:hypothetical protein